MLADVAPALVLTTRDLAPRLPAGAAALALDDAAVLAELATLPASAPGDGERRAPLRPRHPAYLITTSGSTGTPKTVIVTHQGLPNLARGIARALADRRQRAGWRSSPRFSFDGAVAELVVRPCPRGRRWRCRLPRSAPARPLAAFLARHGDQPRHPAARRAARPVARRTCRNCDAGGRRRGAARPSWRRAGRPAAGCSTTTARPKHRRAPRSARRCPAATSAHRRPRSRTRASTSWTTA